MDSSATWTCDCGKLRFRLEPVEGTRCVCYCRDCQAFLAHLGRGDIADEVGGSDLFQTTPNRVVLEAGGEHLANLRLTEKGPLRWYATCCGTPVCNTGASRMLPLASFLVRSFDGEVGPIVARVNRKGARGHIEGEAGNVGRLVRAFIWRALKVLVTGAYRKTPFFKGDGTPVAPTTRLSDEERARAYGD